MYDDEPVYDNLTEAEKASLDEFFSKGKRRIAAKQEVMDSLFAFVDHSGAEVLTNCSYFQRLRLAVDMLRGIDKEEGEF